MWSFHRSIALLAPNYWSAYFYKWTLTSVLVISCLMRFNSITAEISKLMAAWTNLGSIMIVS